MKKATLVHQAPNGMNIPIEISARHVHCDAATWKTLFGTAAPTIDRPISQPPQYAAVERVKLIGPKGDIDHVGTIGPLRTYTQVELAMTDARRLGLTPPLRDSGNVGDAAAITIVGPAGQVTAAAAIIQQRHIHATPADAAALGVTDRQEVHVAISGPRGGQLDQVIVRVDPNYVLRLHLDTDEANALGVTPESHATIVS